MPLLLKYNLVLRESIEMTKIIAIEPLSQLVFPFRTIILHPNLKPGYDRFCQTEYCKSHPHLYLDIF